MMDTNRLPKQALQYKPKGRRNIGRPRKRWRDLRIKEQETRLTLQEHDDDDDDDDDDDEKLYEKKTYNVNTFYAEYKKQRVATGNISRLFRKYLRNIEGKHTIKEQRKTTIPDTV